LLNKLWRRSFIESEGEVDSNSLCFKLHDVMRDLALYILENDIGRPPAKQLYLYRAGQNLENFPQEWEVISKARKLSLRENKLKKLPRRFCAPDLLTLLLYGNPIVSLPGSFLWSLGKLRVLDLGWGEFDSLPEELGNLKNLVWLNLCWCTKLKILPDTVGKLHVLKYLNVCCCDTLKCLPSGLVNLTSLQVLDTTFCGRLIWVEQIPPRMARAESLDHTYPTIGASLEEICGLAFLTELHICGVKKQAVKLPHNITALTQLKYLNLCQLNIETLPAEMAYCFVQLQTLLLFELRFEYLPKSFTCCGAFPALINFGIEGCMCLVEFPEVDKGAMPKLELLDFTECRNLETLPLSLENLTGLQKLSLLDCEQTLKRLL
jgi:Leucine-rich repeat (LRR) protein